MDRTGSRDIGFFDIIADKQAYLSILYLVLSIPLGMLYFMFITTGVLLGICLIPVFIGIPILYVMMLSIKYIMAFERKMTLAFLGMDIAGGTAEVKKGTGMLKRFGAELLDKELWKGLTYLTLKLLLGLIILFLCISLTGLSLGLLATPILLQLAEYSPAFDSGIHFSVNGVEVYSLLGLLGISASPQQEMLILVILGVLAGLGSMHLFNRSAYLMGAVLRLLSPSTIKNVTE